VSSRCRDRLQRTTWEDGTLTAVDTLSGRHVYEGTRVYFGDLDAKIRDVTI